MNTQTTTKLDITDKKIKEYNDAEKKSKKKLFLEIKVAKENSDKALKELINTSLLKLIVCDPLSFVSISGKVFTETIDPKKLCSSKGDGCGSEFCSDYYDDSSCFMDDLVSMLPWIIIPIVIIIIIFVAIKMRSKGGTTITTS